jgi:hypothetical protein
MYIHKSPSLSLRTMRSRKELLPQRHLRVPIFSGTVVFGGNFGGK